jgi:hypothetical protein
MPARLPLLMIVKISQNSSARQFRSRLRLNLPDWSLLPRTARFHVAHEEVKPFLRYLAWVV